MALRARLQVLVRHSRFCYAARWSNGGRTDRDTAGSVRAAGGAWGKKEQAQEDQYFHNLEQEQIKKLQEEAKQHHEEEISHHQDAIKELEEQIQRHKAKIDRHQQKIDDAD